MVASQILSGLDRRVIKRDMRLNFDTGGKSGSVSFAIYYTNRLYDIYQIEYANKSIIISKIKKKPSSKTGTLINNNNRTIAVQQ